MKKARVFALAMATVLAVGLVGCGSGEKEGAADDKQPQQQEQQEPAPAPEPLDLRGSWVMRAKDGSANEFQALVEDDYITVQMSIDGNTMIFWAGTYEAPKDAVEPYSWNSKNDKNVTGMSLIGSSDDTKEFRYEGGVLSCDITIQGEKAEIELEKVDGDKAAEVADSMTPDFEVTIGEASKIVDEYDGGDVLVVSYTWTNNSDEACAFDLSVSTKAFQDGVELKPAFVSGDDFDTMAKSLDIQPGTTQQVWEAYALGSDSDVTVEVSEMWGGRSFGDKTFSVK